MTLCSVDCYFDVYRLHDRSEFVFIENAQIDKTALLTAFDVYRLQDRLEFVIRIL